MPASLLLSAIVALSILLMLLRPRGIPEVVWIGGGALLLVLLRLIPLALAAHAIGEGVDVYLFLIGMMLLSALAQQNGVFDWLSTIAVRAARGSSGRLFTLVYAIGTLTTILLSNDATAVVLTPAILTAVRKSRVEPRPHLFACALIANAASFVVPISNPANLVVFRQGMPPLARWLAAFTLPSLLSIAATYLVLRLLFRRDLNRPIPQSPPPEPLRREARLVLAGLALVIVVLLCMSSLNRDLGLPTCLAALAVAAVVSLTTRTSPLPLAREISWSTLALVAGLFILVRAVETVGALRLATSALHRAASLAPPLAVLVTGFALAVANNLVNNLPLGLIAGAALTAVPPADLLRNTVLIAVDLGPNLSITGSLATILWLLALRKEKIDLTLLDFLKIGAVAMPVALLTALGGVLLQHSLQH